MPGAPRGWGGQSPGAQAAAPSPWRLPAAVAMGVPERCPGRELRSPAVVAMETPTARASLAARGFSSAPAFPHPTQRAPRIPPEVTGLSNLKCLGLTGNRFSVFPEEVFLLQSLEKLYLGQDKGIKFMTLPRDISKLQNLKELYLENNCLEYLPPSIGLLSNLEIVDCHNNLLKELPDSICQVQGLQRLLVQNNQLFQLPENLDNLQKLQLVLLDGNPMTDPPIEVCSQGNLAIWEYLREKRHQKAKATKIQAWWRGQMVRKGLGIFAELQKLLKKGKKDKKGKEKPGKGAKGKKK